MVILSTNTLAIIIPYTLNIIISHLLFLFYFFHHPIQINLNQLYLYLYIPYLRNLLRSQHVLCL